MTMQTPLVASLDFQRQSGQMKRKWSNEMTGKVHGQRGRTLVTMQAKGKGKKKDSDDSTSCQPLHCIEITHQLFCICTHH